MLKPSTRTHPVRRLALVSLVAVVLTLAFAGLAYAAMIAINTNDNAVDPAWAANPKTLVVTDLVDDPSIDNTIEIKKGWIANDANHLSFRQEMLSSPALAVANSAAFGAIDCDGDGSYLGLDDRIIAYWPNAPASVGETVAIGRYTGTGFETLGNLGGEYGEVIAGGNVEFKTPISGQAAEAFAGCLDNEQMVLGTAIITCNDMFCSSISVDFRDQLGFFGWDVPTAVTLRSFGAAGSPPWGAALAIGAVAAGAVLSVRRRLRR